MKKLFMLLLALCFIGIAGCGAASNASNGTGDRSATRAPLTSTSASAEKPLSYYADQYKKVNVKCVADQKEFSAAVPDNGTDVNDNSKLDKIGKRIATDCADADNELVRMQWPGAILADIKAKVAADLPAILDFSELPTRAYKLEDDLVPATAAGNIVQADLGIPADTF